MAKYRTKEGTYGTMYLYRVSYEDRYEWECGPYSASYWAYDAEHAVDRFWEGLLYDGRNSVTIKSVARIKESGR